MTTSELTEEVIAEPMSRAEKVVFGWGHDRCIALPDPVAEAQKT